MSPRPGSARWGTKASPRAGVPQPESDPEDGPPVCGPHWDMLDPEGRARVHGEASREEVIKAALAMIERAEAWIAWHPTRQSRRPAVA
jgi:hypothetical protein